MNPGLKRLFSMYLVPHRSALAVCMQLFNHKSSEILLRRILSICPFDEQWYKNEYQDVSDAIRSGRLPSARAHYINNGYFEGRMPFDLQVPEDWYCSQYPDVSEGIAEKRFRSAKDHFLNSGYAEGRIPFKPLLDSDFYAHSYPDAADSVSRGEFESLEREYLEQGYLTLRFPYRF